SLPPAARQQRQPDDSCTACHMPRLPSADIVHTAVTDHRILRRPEEAAGSDGPRRSLRPSEIPVVNFYEKDLDPEAPETRRDLGLALLYLTRQPGPLREHVGPLGFPLVEQAVQSFPDDAVAWEVLGWGLWLQDRNEEALAACEKALALAPERELTLALAAPAAEALGRADASLAYLRRLVAVNPWLWEYRFSLSRLLAERRDWPAALQACEAALRLNPTSDETRRLLVTCCLHAGQQERARKEFETLLASNPGSAESLREWFAGQKAN